MATPMNGGITRDSVRAALAFGGLHGAGASFNRDQIRAMAREIDTLDDVEARLKRTPSESTELDPQRRAEWDVRELLARQRIDHARAVSTAPRRIP